MTKYTVEAEYIKVLSRKIEADSKDEAIEKGMEDWKKGEDFKEEHTDGKVRFSVGSIER